MDLVKASEAEKDHWDSLEMEQTVTALGHERLLT